MNSNLNIHAGTSTSWYNENLKKRRGREGFGLGEISRPIFSGADHPYYETTYNIW